MIELLDGPAEGQTLALRTAPHFLRVVVAPGGKVDALDQRGDKPEPGEVVHVYVIEPGTWSQVFVRPGGRYEMGRYRHLAGVDTDGFGDRDRWVTWVREHGNATAVAAGLAAWTGNER